MNKLKELIYKGIDVYLAIQVISLLIVLGGFYWFVLRGTKISSEDIFSPQFLIAGIGFLFSIGIVIFSMYFWFKLKKYRVLPEEEQKIKWKEEKKLKYILILILIGMFLFIYVLGGLTVSTIVSMLLMIAVLYGIALGVKYVIKKSEKTAEHSKLFLWVIVIVVMGIVLVAPGIGRLIYSIGFLTINDPSDISECFSATRTEAARANCIHRHIRDTNDIMICNSIEDKQIQKNIEKNDNFYFVKKDDCLLEVAKNLNDASICDSILGNNVRNSCMARIAENTLNISLCKMVQNVEENGQTLYLRDGCLLKIARELKDSAICGMIEEFPYSTSRQECILEIQR